MILSTLSNDLRRLEERRRVAELEQVYGAALGILQGHRTMGRLRWQREDALVNREGAVRLRGTGITRKRKRRRGKR